MPTQTMPPLQLKLYGGGNTIPAVNESISASAVRVLFIFLTCPES